MSARSSVTQDRGLASSVTHDRGLASSVTHDRGLASSVTQDRGLARHAPVGRLLGASLALVVLLWPAPSRAEPAVAPGVYDGRPIVAVDLAGAGAPDRERFEALTRLRAGKRYSAAAIRRMIDALYQTGDYTDIRVDADSRDDGVALTVSFTAKLRVGRVEFEGRHQSEARLREAAALRVGDEVLDSTVPAAVERVRAWYARRGYVVDVTPSVQVDDHGTRARIRIRIDEQDRVRIASIAFPGSPAFSRLRHLVALRTTSGEYFSHDQLDRGVERLRERYYATGYLKAVVGPPRVSQDRRGVSIAVPIERGPRFRVVVEGRPGVRSGTLHDQLTLFQERRDDEDFYAEEAERLTRFLVDLGFRRASVKIERVPEAPDAILVRVGIDAGPRLRLDRVTTAGHTAVPTHELTPLIRTTPSTVFRARFAEGDTLDADRGRLLSWYRAQGFMAAKVAVEVEEDSDRRRAGVTFRIDEGPQTLVGTIRIEGQHAFDAGTLLAQFDVPPGSPYVEGRLRAARAALLAWYNDHGYLYSAVEATAAFSDDRARADLSFVIDEGIPVTIGPITLGGNERTRDDVILRELQVKPGDVYVTRRILESQRRVARLGFLREVRLEPVDSSVTQDRGLAPDRREPVKALRLTVKERDAGTVDLGAGYANFEGARGFTELTYRNLGGTGRRIGFLLEGSRLERKGVISYRHPWVFSRPMDGRVTLLDETRNEENRGYERTTYGVSLGLDKDFSPALRGSLVYDYQFNRFDPAPPQDNDRANIGSVTPALTRDTRDDPFNPRSGSVNTLAFENAALVFGSQEQFWKVTASSGWFHAIGNALVGAVSARIGASNRFGETRANRFGEALLLPATERFYLGGRSTVRGYDEDTLGPIGADGRPTGGNLMLVGNAELRIRLPRAFGAILFWDGGNVWPRHQDLRWTDVKTTVGSGIRYNTPVGPLRLDYGHKLNWQPGEAHGAFHFTLGHAF